MRFKEVILPAVSFFAAVLASLVVLAVGFLLASLSHPGALPVSQQPTLSRFFLTHNGLLRKLIISGILCSGLGSPLTVLLLLKSETPSAGRFRFRNQVRGVLPLLGGVLLLITVCVGVHGLFGLQSFGPWGSAAKQIDFGIEIVGVLAGLAEFFGVVGFGLLFSAFELYSRQSQG